MMEMLFFIVMMVVIVVLQAMTPYVIRRGESFGVMIGEKSAEDPAIRRMKRQFMQWNLVIGAIVTVMMAVILAFTTESENTQAVVLIAGIFAVLIASFLVYLRFHKESLVWKRENLHEVNKVDIVMVDTTFHRQKLTISYAWYLIPFVLICMTVGLTVIYYDQIPSMIPMQYNFDNEITRMVAKSYRTVMMMPMMQLAMLGLFIFINFMMTRSKQVIDNDNPSLSMKRNVMFRRIYSQFNFVMGTLLILLFMVIQMSFIFAISQVAIMTMTIAVLVIIFGGLIFLMVRVGQGGSRLKLREDDDASARPVRDDDAYWKMGVFYVNRHDPAVFVEKRFGVGWTINMARPTAWLTFIAMIGMIVVISIIFS